MHPKSLSRFVTIHSHPRPESKAAELPQGPADIPGEGYGTLKGLELRDRVKSDLVVTMTNRLKDCGYPIHPGKIPELAAHVLARADAPRDERLAHPEDFDHMGTETLLMDDAGWEVIDRFLERIGQNMQFDHPCREGSAPGCKDMLVMALHTSCGVHPLPTAQAEDPRPGTAEQRRAVLQQHADAHESAVRTARRLLGNVTTGTIDFSRVTGSDAGHVLPNLDSLGWYALVSTAATPRSLPVTVKLPHVDTAAYQEAMIHMINQIQASTDQPERLTVVIPAGAPLAQGRCVIDILALVQPSPSILIDISHTGPARGFDVMAPHGVRVQLTRAANDMREFAEMNIHRPSDTREWLASERLFFADRPEGPQA